MKRPAAASEAKSVHDSDMIPLGSPGDICSGDGCKHQRGIEVHL